MSQPLDSVDPTLAKVRDLTAPAPAALIAPAHPAPAAPQRPAHMAPSALGGLALRLRTLAVFRGLLADPVIQRLLTYLDVRQGNAPLNACVSAYGDFAAALYDAGHTCLATYVQAIVNDDENAYIRAIGRGEDPGRVLTDATAAELRVLQAVADLTPAALRDGLAWQGPLPGFEAARVDLAGDYIARTADIGRYGYGMYARYRMFFLDRENRIVPVRNPDRTRLAELVDYRRQQQAILDNTRALLAGRPAANILLKGDAGTGKSSTVKAVVNELADEGLRILEVRKDQLHAIPGILDELTCNPLKFILFIDDLSFQRDDDDYAALKAILEGSVAAKSPNVVIYATSNRRHLVKESFSDRDGDDIHRNDTMQEIVSLSERFGLQVSFYKPDKATYLDIVRHLAVEAGILGEKPLESEGPATSGGDAVAETPAGSGKTSESETPSGFEGTAESGIPSMPGALAGSDVASDNGASACPGDPEAYARQVAELEAAAEQFALGRGGRSARAARQFVDSLLAGR